MNKLIWMSVCGLLAGGVLACGGQNDDGAETANAGDAAEAAQFSSYEASLALSATSETGSGATAEEIASAAAQNAGNAYTPSNCVDATTEGATVTYNLNGCTGPLGLAETSGIVVVTYSREDGKIRADINGDDLAINNGMASIDTKALYSESGDTSTLEITTNSSGTTGRGRAFTRSGTYTASWVPGEGCLSLDGSWGTIIGNAEWTTTVTDYTQCEGECPQAGAELAWEGERGASLTLSFDGSDQVSWETGRGRTGTSPLQCGG